jgi:hypothetical protein
VIVLALALALVHDGEVTASRLERRGDEVWVAFSGPRRPLRIWGDGRELQGREEGGRLRFTAAGPAGALRVRVELEKGHSHVVQFPDGRTRLLDAAHPEAEWTASGGSGFGSFLALGVEHILTGWDHLVFLLTLLVVAGSLGQVAKLVTAFTAAHSVTLGLTALGVVSPPGFVEALIAASIVYVAVENWFVKEGAHRWVLVSIFGLVHGMGFGGALLEMELARPVPALLGFNLGVELGQLAVVAAVWPLLAWARRHERVYRAVAVRGLSGAAAAAGLVWLIGRAV